VPVPNRARLETGAGKMAIDVRGDGGYVIAPGSVHASGQRYRFAGDWTVTRDALPRFWAGVVAEADATNREAERAATLTATDRAVDRVVMPAIRDYPAATSISRLRPYTGLQTAAVGAAVSRLIRAGLALEGKRGLPFTVTPAGIATLTDGEL
jgi:hypothetical protein